MPVSKAFALVVMSLAVMSAAPLGQAWAACALFEHSGFSGRSVDIKANTAVADLGQLDDSASSVKVERGCLLVGFSLPSFKGPTETWGPGEYAALPEGWNDKISSAQCNCR